MKVIVMKAVLFVLFALSLSFLLKPAFSDEPAKEKRYVDLWKAGDGWEIEVVRWASKEKTQRFHVIILGTENWGKIPCWKISFLVAGAGSQERSFVLLNKFTAWPEKILQIRGKDLIDVPLGKIQNTQLPLEPPAGIPLDLFPLWGEPEMKRKQDGSSLVLERIISGQRVSVDATIKFKSNKEYIVRQEWVAGEPWWRSYERHVDGEKVLAARLLSVPKEKTPAEKKPIIASKKDLDWSGIKNDPRLQVRIVLDLKGPTVPDILKPLRETTGVPLAIDESNVEQVKPAMGSLSLRNVPAWMVMDQVAQSKAVRGNWVKSKDGYRLVGTVTPSSRPSTSEVAEKREKPSPDTQEEEAGGNGARIWLTLGGLVILAGGSYWAWRHYRSKKAGAVTKPPTAAVKPAPAPAKTSVVKKK